MNLIKIKLIFFTILCSVCVKAQIIEYPMNEDRGVNPIIEIQPEGIQLVLRDSEGREISRESLVPEPAKLEIAIVPVGQTNAFDMVPPVPPMLDPNFNMDEFMRDTTQQIMNARAQGQDPLSIMHRRNDYLLWDVKPEKVRHWSFYRSGYDGYLTFYNRHEGSEILQIKVPAPAGRGWKEGSFLSYDQSTNVNMFGYPSDRGYQTIFVHKGAVFSAVSSIRDPLVDGLRTFDQRVKFEFDSLGTLQRAVVYHDNGDLAFEMVVSLVSTSEVIDFSYLVQEAVELNSSAAAKRLKSDVSATIQGQQGGSNNDSAEIPTEEELGEILEKWVELDQVQGTINTGGGSPEQIKDILSGILQELSIKQTKERRFDIEDSVDHILEPFAVNLMKDEINGVDLVGAPGVGKTWTANALAHEFFWNSKLPLRLRKTQFFALDASAFTATDGIVGRIERRAHALIELAKLYPHIVFVIDEIHSLKGAGVSMGSNFDVWNFLKPHMANGTLKIVGMGTEKELDIAYQDDQALRERRPRITIEEPAVEKMPKILNSWLVGYGYKGSLSEEVALEIAKLARRMGSTGANPRRSTTLLDHIMAIRKFRGVPSDKLVSFTIAELYEYAENFYGADASLFSREALASRIENFGELFDQNVIGLEHVKSTMERKLINHFLPRAAGIQVPGQRLLLAGPPGSGKTYSSKILALAVSGKKSIEELIEGRDYGLLKGANYSNHDDAERFLRDVAQIVSINKFAVITLDEIDRAHPKVQDTLLSILTEGIVEPASNNSFGNKVTNLVDISLAQFIFTTNQGEAYVEKVGVDNFKKQEFLKSAPGLVPALVDRLTVVPVPNADKSEIVKILEMSVKQTLASFKAEFGFTVEISDLSYLVQEIISEVSGEPGRGMGFQTEGQVKSKADAEAENVKISARQEDKIERMLIDPINRYILKSSDLVGASLVFDVKAGTVLRSELTQKQLQCRSFLSL